MPTQHVLYTLSVDDVPVGIEVTPEVIAQWFQRARQALSSTEGWSCMSFVGPVPRVSRRPHLTTDDVHGAWLAEFEDRCWYQVDPVRQPYDPAEAMRGAITLFSERYTQALREIVRGDMNRPPNPAISPGNYNVVTRAMAHAPALMGTVDDWRAGRAQLSNTTDDASWWRSLFQAPDNPLGPNPLVPPSPQPSTFTSLVGGVRELVIWGTVGVAAFYGLPIAFRAVRRMEERGDFDAWLKRLRQPR